MSRHEAKVRAGTFRRQKAMTLIELLTVISVIAVLMGMLLPAVNKARSIAQRTACKGNLHTLSIAFKMYRDQYWDIMPPACQFPSIEDANDEDSKPPITEFLLPYVQEKEVFKCPSDRDKNYFVSEGTSYEYNSRLGGKPVSKSRLAQKLKLKERNIDIMHDYEPFHGRAGKPGSTNYLYADGHVGDFRKQ